MDNIEIGNKVRVINYGHEAWCSKSEWAEMLKLNWTKSEKPKHLIRETDTVYLYDSNPEYIGIEGVVTDIQPTNKGNLFGIHITKGSGKASWYSGKQLELIK